MGSSEILVSEDSQTTATRNCRAKPLYTIGVSVLSITHKVYTKAESRLGPISFITRNLAKIFAPIVYAMQYQLLVILSYTDEQMLALENLLETIFPPTTYIFDKIDELVYTTESLVMELENALVQYHWKRLLINVLGGNKEFVGDKEKQPMSDYQCSDFQIKEEGRVYDEVGQVQIENEIEPVQRDSGEEELDSVVENYEVASKVEGVREDPILELFAEGWYMR